ncbi:hypothetical protein IWQ61_008249 [Dispira simplex]|nr:hypothetical protein IWQ61_008249 [Dispira simplex]
MDDDVDWPFPDTLVPLDNEPQPDRDTFRSFFKVNGLSLPTHATELAETDGLPSVHAPIDTEVGSHLDLEFFGGEGGEDDEFSDLSERTNKAMTVPTTPSEFLQLVTSKTAPHSPTQRSAPGSQQHPLGLLLPNTSLSTTELSRRTTLDKPPRRIQVNDKVQIPKATVSPGLQGTVTPKLTLSHPITPSSTTCNVQGPVQLNAANKGSIEHLLHELDHERSMLGKVEQCLMSKLSQLMIEESLLKMMESSSNNVYASDQPLRGARGSNAVETNNYVKTVTSEPIPDGMTKDTIFQHIATQLQDVDITNDTDLLRLIGSDGSSDVEPGDASLAYSSDNTSDTAMDDGDDEAAREALSKFLEQWQGDDL